MLPAGGYVGEPLVVVHWPLPGAAGEPVVISDELWTSREKLADVIWASAESLTRLKVVLSFSRIPIRAAAMAPTTIGRMTRTMRSSRRVNPSSFRQLAPWRRLEM